MERSVLILAKEVAKNNRISALAKLLLAQLLDHRNKTTGQCNPKIATLAEELAVSRRTIERAIRQLCEAGMLRVIWRQRSSQYEILMRQIDLSEILMRQIDLSAAARARGSITRARDSHHQEEELRIKTLDDEKTRTPEQTFLGRLAHRHGEGFGAADCLGKVKRQLESAGVAFADFLVYDEARTTGTQFTNPPGYYIHLAKEVSAAARQRLFAAAVPLVAPTPEYARDAHGRCEVCGGSGQLGDGGFCAACPLGRDLEGLQRRGVGRETNPARKKGAAA